MNPPVYGKVVLTIFILLADAQAQSPMLAPSSEDGSSAFMKILNDVGAGIPGEYRIGPDDNEVTKLQKQRIDMISAELELLQIRIAGSTITQEAYWECEERLSEALLDFHSGDTERLLAILQKKLERAVKLEKLVSRMNSAGVRSPESLYRVTANRIGVELEILRLKADQQSEAVSSLSESSTKAASTTQHATHECSRPVRRCRFQLRRR